MTNNFFEKLKKGMNIEETAELKKEELEIGIEEKTKKEVKETMEEMPRENSEENEIEKKQEPIIEEDPKTTEDNPEIEAEFQIIGAESTEPKNSEEIKETVLTSKKIKPKKEKKRKTKKMSDQKKVVQKENIKIKQESILTGDKTEETAIFDKQGQLTIDVFETDKNIVIQSAVGGVIPENLEIIIEKDMVCIKGKRERCEEEETERFFFQECYWGRFSREIILPVLVDSSKSQASLENGILTIKIPKIEKQDNSQKINIKAI